MQWWQGLRFTIAGFSWEFVWWLTDVSVNTQFMVPWKLYVHYTSFAACTCVYVVIALLALKIQSWSSLHTMRRRNYLETSIAIIKMPGYCSESHSQLYQSSTNVRLHSCSFIIQFLSLLAVRLIIMITLCIAPQRDFLWPESRPCVAHIFHTLRYVCIICNICIYNLHSH